jgi:hypothetical protein
MAKKKNNTTETKKTAQKLQSNLESSRYKKDEHAKMSDGMVP